MRQIYQFFTDEAGQDVVEYSLLLVLVAAIGLIAMTVLGVPIKNLINKATGRLSEVAETDPFTGQ